MKISPVNFEHRNFAFKNNNCTTIAQNKLDTQKSCLNELFYIQMQGYEKNERWAAKMSDCTRELAFDIKQKADFEYLLEKIKTILPEINNDSDFYFFYGQMREASYGSVRINDKSGRGSEYFKKYKKLLPKSNFFSPMPPKQYPDASTACIYCDNSRGEPKNLAINFGYKPQITSDNFEFMKAEYENLLSIENPSIDEVNRTTAAIQWLFAQSSPFKKGNDCAANLLTKAIYLANDCAIYPVKKGKSLDFEAYGSEFDDYIKNYPKFYKRKPRKVTSYNKF